MFIFSKTYLRSVWVAITVVGTVSIWISATTYFRPGPTPLFLLEKGDLQDNVFWRTAFYFHVIGSCLCLAAGPLLMIGRLIRWRSFHRVVGYFYLNSVLWVAAPCGLMISPNAKAGQMAAAGFLLTGVLWWTTTWLAYRSIRGGDLSSHIRWAVRSYAIALSAIAFRFIQLALSQNIFGFQMDHDSNYIASVWLSLIVSVWISETCISRHRISGRSVASRTISRGSASWQTSATTKPLKRLIS
ncbi:MAG: DUF2306 domain-containing protein [Pirellulaceae bacterium]|nr:DUF2306 domain-containing protein [Pirellulaceae bacterium]